MGRSRFRGYWHCRDRDIHKRVAARQRRRADLSSSAAAFVGGSGVTTSPGFLVAANTPVLIPTTGSETLELYGVVSSGTATISHLSIS
ncbi:hypothetical protein [Mycobacterium sp.]|uniref:hypothetical protein n=1 Tax=Mycobacterium sp. TaxID=1785 RepID=UPI003C71A327